MSTMARNHLQSHILVNNCLVSIIDAKGNAFCNFVSCNYPIMVCMIMYVYTSELLKILNFLHAITFLIPKIPSQPNLILLFLRSGGIDPLPPH